MTSTWGDRCNVTWSGLQDGIQPRVCYDWSKFQCVRTDRHLSTSLVSFSTKGQFCTTKAVNILTVLLGFSSEADFRSGKSGEGGDANSIRSHPCPPPPLLRILWVTCKLLPTKMVIRLCTLLATPPWTNLIPVCPKTQYGFQNERHYFFADPNTWQAK